MATQKLPKQHLARETSLLGVTRSSTSVARVPVISEGSHNCANFRLRCDTIDDSGGSTQRHDDVDKCANDLRHEMALEMWIVSVHEKSEQL